MRQNDRISVALLFGGPSQEHEISLLSAGAIWRAMDEDKYRRIGIGITTEGRWFKTEQPERWLNNGIPDDPGSEGDRVLLHPGDGLVVTGADAVLNVDVVFPVLHGPFGEDGTVQGALELCGLPYVGSPVASSAVAMDKQLMKELFDFYGLPVVRHHVYFRDDFCVEMEKLVDSVAEDLGFPCFVKPANLGSSVGISRVDAKAQLRAAMERAAKHGRRIMVEQGVEGARELECSVLGNRQLRVAGPGEVIPAGAFYDYRSKYHDDDTRLEVAPRLPDRVVKRIRSLASRAFRAVKGCGMARVDFFYTPEQGIIVNEINTIPGFTAVSMYPRLWSAQGLSFSQLVDRLVQLALDRYELERSWRNSPSNEE